MIPKPKQTFQSDSDNTNDISLMKISDNEFELIRSLVYNQFGISLTDQKKSLVVGRLQSLLKQKHCSTFMEYYKLLTEDKTNKSLSDLINRISTNHTFFFREKDHFELLESTILPKIVNMLREKNQTDLRIWCAACSSGEEAYCIQMTIMNYFKNDYGLWDAGLLATDISAKALEIGKTGVYPAERVTDIPKHFQNAYFSKRADGSFVANDRIRKEITFRRFNLMNEKFPFSKPFQIIFCRNVMIYFDQETRTSLVKRFCDALVPGGYLLIGHSESIQKTSDLFDYVFPSVYQKKVKHGR